MHCLIERSKDASGSLSLKSTMSDIVYAFLPNHGFTLTHIIKRESPITPLDDASAPAPQALSPGTASAQASATQARPERTRRKLDLSQNKRGAFSVLMGTLSKAKTEDKQRNASEAVRLPFTLNSFDSY